MVLRLTFVKCCFDNKTVYQLFAQNASTAARFFVDKTGAVCYNLLIQII